MFYTGCILKSKKKKKLMQKVRHWFGLVFFLHASAVVYFSQPPPIFLTCTPTCIFLSLSWAELWFSSRSNQYKNIFLTIKNSFPKVHVLIELTIHLGIPILWGFYKMMLRTETPVKSSKLKSFFINPRPWIQRKFQLAARDLTAQPCYRSKWECA